MSLFTREPGSHRKVLVGTLGVAAACLLAACGTSSGASSGASSSTGASKTSQQGPTASDVAYAKSTVAAAEAVPSWTPPGSSVDTSSLKGKTLLVIPLTTAVSFCNDLDASTETAAKAIGLNVQVYPTTGQPSQWAAGIEQGISEHVAAIALECAINPSLITPQLQAAKSAGIPVIDSVLTDPSETVPSSLTGVTSDPYYQGMKLEALDAIATQNGKPVHALLLSSSSFLTSPGMTTAFEDELAKRCGSECTVDNVDIPLTQWATQVQSSVSSALTSHPDINTIAIEFDGMVPLVLPGVGSATGVSLYAWGGGTSVVNTMPKTPSLKLDIGEGPVRIGYTVVDEVARALVLHKTSINETVPIRAFTLSNYAADSDPTSGYGNAFIPGFRSLWGLG
jgi:ribose transport system substrate-binding protein